MPQFALPRPSLDATLFAGRLRSPSALAVLVGGVLAFGALASCAVVTASGLTLAAGGFARFVALAGLMFALAQWCRWRLPKPRLGQAAAMVGAATLGLLFAGIVSNAGLRLGLPLVDARLAAADAAVGLDAGKVIEAVTTHPRLVEVLSFAYNSSGALVVALIFGALALNRSGKAWELAATAIVSMQLVAAASPFAPAWGAMRHFALEPLQGHGLPSGAGVYQWPAFGHFYVGGDPMLRLTDMGGVVAFPSFHTVLALIISQALGETRLRWVGIGWTAAIILAAIPMGGHYVVDLAAGFVVWLFAATLARRVSSPSG